MDTAVNPRFLSQITLLDCMLLLLVAMECLETKLFLLLYTHHLHHSDTFLYRDTFDPLRGGGSIICFYFLGEILVSFFLSISSIFVT